MKSMFHPLKSMQKFQKAWIEHGFRRITWVRFGLPDSDRVKSLIQPCLSSEAKTYFRLFRVFRGSLTTLPLLILLAALTSVPQTTSAGEPEVHFPEKHFDFLEKYCLDCHDSLTEKGEVNLEDLPFH
ncbi:MAG: hypothetical protein HRU46_22005, partial [Verrucomicrobiales bacterium]|nr:hypothetical protein [Verrucomicrobiales bacterium]